jgi:hypothetical protein
MTDRQMVNMLYDPALLKRIDDFRFKHRFDTRTDAIRWLLTWALDQKPRPKGGK